LTLWIQEFAGAAVLTVLFTVAAFRKFGCEEF
jgi:hypothetical protein